MKPIQLTIPDFFLCEQPIKDGSNLDQRMWIYSRVTISLIEVIPEDEIIAVIDRSLIQKRFKYINSDGIEESFLLVFIQNNCAMVEANPLDLLNKAWSWFEKYLKWEDGNIDESDFSVNN